MLIAILYLLGALGVFIGLAAMHFNWPFEELAIYLGNILFILGVIVDNNAQRPWQFWLALAVFTGEALLAVLQLRVWLRRPAK